MMNNIFGHYNEVADSIDRYYVDKFHNETSYQKITDLKDYILKFSNTLNDKSHSVIKAKCFDYLLKNADICVNPHSLFGITLQVQNFRALCDRGCFHFKVLSSLSDEWKGELKDKLNLPEDEHFVENAKGHLLNEFYIDYNHSTPCWEDILSLGFDGLYHRISEYKKKHSPLTSDQADYFLAMKITYKAILEYFERISSFLKDRKEPKLQFMKKAIDNIKNNPPSNTYEALLLSWIYWYLQEYVDCVRCRTMGGLDELYLKFYNEDTENGVFTKDEIKELFVYFMSEFNAFRVSYQQPMYLGGTYVNGDCIVNELSYLILEAYNVLSKPNPKMQIKIGKNTPDEFIKASLDTVRRGNSSISFINDDNAYLSLKKIGVPEDEARTYLMAGCWDYTVRNHEVKTIPVRASLPKILEYTMTNGICLSTGEKVGCETGTEFETFDDFYQAYKKQFLYIWNRTKPIIENWEKYLKEINPSNMFSATMTDSLECARDGYADGMKYNTTVFTLAGLATVVDSICVIKKFVFDKKILTLNEFTEILKNNWEGNESLRLDILKDDDKYGNGSDYADDIMVDLTKYLSDLINKAPNGRGSYWKIGLLSIDKNIAFGKTFSATPDGRYMGDPISKNLSPNIGMDRKGLTTLISSLNKIDYSDFPHAGIVDLILHPSAVAGEEGLNVFMGILKTFFNGGGHSVQFNVFSADTLKDAQRNPDKYKNLQVRVCGWNVYFTELNKVAQDAFIAQCEHNESGV